MKQDAFRIEIVNRIKDMAAANGGVPPTREAFTRATKIGIAKWKGVYWVRWGEALIEAGFKPDARRRSDVQLLEEYGGHALELKRLPTSPDLRMRSQLGKRTSNWTTYRKRFGNRAGLNARLVNHWKGREGEEEIRAICGKRASRIVRRAPDAIVPGFIYLMESGGLYKIGKAVCVETRYKELVLMTPHELVILHRIKTDDSYGIETYWHKRFGEKRVKGEWFRLDEEDVKVICRQGVM